MLGDRVQWFRAEAEMQRWQEHREQKKGTKKLLSSCEWTGAFKKCSKRGPHWLLQILSLATRHMQDRTQQCIARGQSRHRPWSYQLGTENSFLRTPRIIKPSLMGMSTYKALEGRQYCFAVHNTCPPLKGTSGCSAAHIPFHWARHSTVEVDVENYISLRISTEKSDRWYSPSNKRCR